MKKSILSLSALLLLITSRVTAQDTYMTSIEPARQQKLRFGAFLAPTMSWMRPANSKSNDGQYNVINNGNKLGFTWGLIVDYWFAENYAFSTGLQINGCGGKIKATKIIDPNAPIPINHSIASADFNYRLQYFEIPLNLKMRTAPLTKNISFFGQLGVTPGLNIGKKATYTVTSTEVNAAPIKEENVKIVGTLSVAPLTIQLNVGAGATYPINDNLLAYVGVFFNNGFAPDATNPARYNFTYTPTLGSFSDGNIRLNNVALRLGLIF